MKRALPTDSTERKNYPLFRGFMRYFPAAIAGAARISEAGNRKHNPGEELHHARGKSMDHGDCIMRHLHDADEMETAIKRGPLTVDSDFKKALLDEVDQLFWRAGAYSQEMHEKYGDAPLAAGARLSAEVCSGHPDLILPKRMGIGLDADGGAVQYTSDKPRPGGLYENHDG